MEQQIIFDCLRAIAYGPFIDDRIFGTLIGLERDFVKRLVDDWPLVDFEQAEVRRAIGASFNNLLGYPHKKKDAFEDYSSTSFAEVRTCYARWRTVCQAT